MSSMLNHTFNTVCGTVYTQDISPPYRESIEQGYVSMIQGVSYISALERKVKRSLSEHREYLTSIPYCYVLRNIRQRAGWYPAHWHQLIVGQSIKYP